MASHCGQYLLAIARKREKSKRGILNKPGECVNMISFRISYIL